MNQIRLLVWLGGLAAAVLFLPGCGADQSAPPGGNTFADPFAYCAAVGTIDAPDTGYTGPEVPEAVINRLREKLDMADDAPAEWLSEGTAWRCMDGQVWACFVGANLPCTAKANTSRTPTAEMTDFCRENPNADVVPAAVTGRETVYEWRCKDGAPEVVKQLVEPDAQGFLSNIWYEIQPE
ncbi:MAG: hypothetical protein JW953_17220 [Anaerolineae bacterium]|nr:hypothetical protein [Anaerolineae bacterium]